MPGYFVIYPSHYLIYSRVTGLISRDEMVALRQRTTLDPEFDPAFDVIVDLREADLSAWSSSDISLMASATALDKSARRVIVADTDDKFGLARVYATRRDLAGGEERILVVHTMAAGLDWLGLHRFDPSREGREK